MIEDCRMNIEDLRTACGGSIIKTIDEPLAESHGVSSNAIEILSQQAAEG
jgi:hypothetical protein